MQLSYRRRLTLFFLLIVVLPMVSLAVLVVDISGESSTGKADARLGADLEVALALYQQAADDAEAAATEIARDPQLASALASGDPVRIEALARRAASRSDLASLRLLGGDDEALAQVGSDEPAAPGEVDLSTPDGANAGTLIASTVTVTNYLDQVRTLTGEHAVVLAPDGAPLGGTVATADLDLPSPGEGVEFELEGEKARAAVSRLPGSEGLRLALFGPVESAGFLASSPGVAAALAAFFAIAVVFIVLLRRTLQGQVTEMLGAARRLGEGDFSHQVPVQGSDEMAGLASEFNKMSGRLGEQMNQLRRQRTEIEHSVQRIGAAFASGLDRQALLGIVVETAVGACEADYGLIALSGRVGAEAESGTPSTAMQEAALAAEQEALREREVVSASADGAHALACPLLRVGRPSDPLGAMTVARAGRSFTSDERDVFRYLLGQAAASVENIALHEQVSEQAVTDELTGLANKRAFREWMQREVARAERFSHHVSLLMLDLDDFKRVNDTYGHLQGDAVLRAVGRVLILEARAVDHLARYGGEEFVVAMPETDVDGASELAERIRLRIAVEPVPSIGGEGEIGVTVSVGAATMAGGATDASGLVAAADEALYAAKEAGKNQVVVAPAEPSSAGGQGRPQPVAKGRPRARRA